MLPDRSGSVVLVTPDEARDQGLVCCPNPFCWNGKIGNETCGVCGGQGQDPVWWRIDWCCHTCHRYPCVCAASDDKSAKAEGS